VDIECTHLNSVHTFFCAPLGISIQRFFFYGKSQNLHKTKWMETLLMKNQEKTNIFWVLTHISAPSPFYGDSRRPDCGHQIGCTQLVLTADKGQLKPAGCVFTGLLYRAFFPK